jgi:general secretion pathway protein I
MPFFSRNRAGTAGFSLVEVLVALTIVGLTLGTIANVFGSGLFGHVAASDIDTALALAEGRLDAAGIHEPLRPGRTAGVFADRFRWQLVISRYEDKTSPAIDQSAMGFWLFRLEITIAWQRDRRERRVSLATLRLASASL